jgi:hypothetical protein
MHVKLVIIVVVEGVEIILAIKHALCFIVVSFHSLMRNLFDNRQSFGLFLVIYRNFILRRN